MKIVENKTFDIFQSKFGQVDSIVIPILSSHERHVRHSQNSISVLFVYFMDDDSYIIPIDHHEAVNVKMPYTERTVYTFDKKILCSVIDLPNVVDVNFLYYMNTSDSLDLMLEDTPAHTFLKRTYSKRLDNLNYIIPLVKHAESCIPFARGMKKVVEQYASSVETDAFKFLNNAESNAFQFIERSGLYIDVDAFHKKFGERSDKHVDEDVVFTEYNLYNMTGRPSNRHGGVNYAALPKEDGTRSMFKSRYGEQGGLIQLDYDGYHLRIIGELIGYSFPNGSVHEHFGKRYFGVDTLTDEQYSESKKISFSLLYGGVTDEYKDIKYFQQTQRIISVIYDKYENDGHIESPISGRRLWKSSLGEMNPQKLFSYYIQMLETDYNIVALNSVIPLFENRKTKIALYTYDALLLDYSKNDGKEFLLKVKSTLEHDGKFPMKVYFGKDYHFMVDMTEHFRF